MIVQLHLYQHNGRGNAREAFPGETVSVTSDHPLARLDLIEEPAAGAASISGTDVTVGAPGTYSFHAVFANGTPARDVRIECFAADVLDVIPQHPSSGRSAAYTTDERRTILGNIARTAPRLAHTREEWRTVNVGDLRNYGW